MTTVNFIKITNAAARITKYIHPTPVIESKYINDLIGRKVYFKCENQQNTGSFKIRGVANNILSKLEKRRPLTGLIAHSSGNHGRAVAFMGGCLDLPVVVVVPRLNPNSKARTITDHKMQIVFCDNTLTSRITTCEKMATELGFEIIPEFDCYFTIAGQGTLGLEFLKEVPKLDCLLTPVGGGALSSGCSIAMKSLRPNLKVYCVEPEGKELEKSLKAGERLWKGEPNFLDTIASGLKIEQPGKLTFPILSVRCEKEVFTMNDNDMADGMELSTEHLKEEIDASSGACVQALVKYNHRIPASCLHIGVILSGGNKDVDQLNNFL